MKTAALILIAGAGFAADQATLERGKAEEQRACIACHSLRLNHSQRLSRAQWGKELDKMAGWGATIKDRDALWEYLAANYGDDKPASPPSLSLDGAKK
jgi:mono/diheme cytochrome c family protein